MDNIDIINKLAELAFASRFKRLGERLMRDVSRLYHKLDVDFEDRWFTILYTLSLKSPLTITGIAQSLSLTHSAINQLTSEMIENGLLSSAKGKRDSRQRLLSITPKGEKVITNLKPIWEEIRLATHELVKSTGCDILSAIGKIEKQLDEQNMYERVWIRLRGRPPGEIKILEYRPAYKKYFISLNQEWLQEYFEIEEKDQQIMSDPNLKIIKKGGAIFFAEFDNVIVGTAALIRHRNGIFELAKMAVTKNVRGLGIGSKLSHRIIEQAKCLGANEIFLQTSPELIAANHLYRKLGFRKTKNSSFVNDRYSRQGFTMRLNLQIFQS